MKKRSFKQYIVAFSLIAAFVVWTIVVCWVDVRPIGPEGTAVGLATLNRFVHSLTGVHMWLYTVTDLLGVVPLLVALAFAALGLMQWIKERSIRRVERSVIALGVLYAAAAAAFMLFEVCVVNYRPVLIEGALEASYPSSTTLTVLCVMPTAAMQLCSRMKKGRLRKTVLAAIWAFALFMVIGRLASGVHWVTDIVGGMLLSAGLVTLYHAADHPSL